MSETKFTPGPWLIETVRTSCGVCHKVGPWPHKWRAGDTVSACIYDDYPSPPEGTDTMLANARLVAAAPDMLEALKLALEYWADRQQRYRNRHPAWVQAARAALSKTEGREASR